MDLLSIYISIFTFLIISNILVIIFITCFSVYKYIKTEYKDKDILEKLKANLFILSSSLIGLYIIKLFLAFFKKFH